MYFSCFRVCDENNALMATLEARSDQMRKMTADKMGTCFICNRLDCFSWSCMVEIAEVAFATK